jgi:hypothetical protein
MIVLEENLKSPAWWYMCIIPSTCEAEIGGW